MKEYLLKLKLHLKRSERKLVRHECQICKWINFASVEFLYLIKEYYAYDLKVILEEKHIAKCWKITSDSKN